jgi:hypothetical protein
MSTLNMMIPSTKEDWAIWHSGNVVREFIEDNNISNDDDLMEWIYADNTDKLHNIFKHIMWNYYSEINNENEK